MTTHLRIVAAGFRAIGAILALASLVSLADLARSLWLLPPVPPPDNGKPLDIGTYGVIALIDDVGRGADHVFHALAPAFIWLLELMAVAAGLLLLFAVLLYFIGRGIGRHAAWARIAAILLSTGMALLSALAVTTLHGNIVPVAAVPLVLSLYSLWVLVLRFN